MTEVPRSSRLMLQALATYRQGDLRYAVELLDEAIAVEGDERVRTLIELQKIPWLRESGSSDAALRLGERVERRLAAWPPEEVAGPLADLAMERGVQARQRGDLAAAESYLVRAEQLAGSLPADHRRVVLPTIRANKASVLLDLGRLTEARDLVLEALEGDRRLGDDRGEAHDLNLLGIINQRMGNQAAADRYYRESIDVARAGGLTNSAAQAAANRASLAGEPPSGEAVSSRLGSDQACIVSNRGVAAFRRGDYDEAAELLRRAADLHVRVGVPAHSVHDRINLSHAELLRGHLDEAVAVARSARDEARERHLTLVQWYAEYRYAEVVTEAAANGSAVAGAETPEALRSIRNAMDCIELLRVGIDHPEDRQWMFTGKERVYRLALLLHVGKSDKQCFEISERARARAFLESAGAGRIGRIERHSPAARRRRALTGQALRGDLDPGERARIIAELSRLRAEITRDSPRLAPLTGDALPDLDEVCAAVPETTRLVSFFLLDRSTLAVFLLGRPGIHAAYLARTGRPIDEVVGELRGQIEADAEFPEAGAELYRQLFGPLRHELDGVAELFVVPHGILNHVPWSALWFPLRAEPGRVFLRNRFLIAQLPSAGFLPLLRSATAPFHETLLVVGDPGGELSGASEEARAVAALLGVQPFIGGAAVRDLLLDADRPRLVHVCCHGRFDTADPLLSGLELADGLVSVEDLLERGPAAQLMVLSACLTGLSAQRAGDELVGLARAALSRGGRAVLAALWSVSDASSAVFFRFFYAALRDGLTAGQALFLAQDQVPENYPEFDRPFDWAPFVLIGDPDVRLFGPAA